MLYKEPLRVHRYGFNKDYKTEFEQLKSLDEAAGKTIEHAIGGQLSSCLAISFTDKTFLYAVSEHGSYDDDAEIDYDGGLPTADTALKLGMIDQAEYDRSCAEAEQNIRKATREFYREAVKRGAKMLDEKRPGWEGEINIARLELSRCSQCILGQLYGHYWKGTEKLNIDSDSWGADERNPAWFGFDRLAGFGYNEGTAHYDAIRDEWAKLIMERRALTTA